MRSTTSKALTLAPATLVLLLVVLADPARAAAHAPLALLPSIPSIPNPIEVVGSGIDAIGGAASGLLDFGVEELGKLVVNLISGILDKLIPDSIQKKGADVLIWSVSVENWGRRGGRAYPAINQLQHTLTWLGVALMTTGGAWSGLRVVAGLEAVEDAIRGWATAIGGIALFSWGYTQAAALTNSISSLVLHQPQVFKGLDLLALAVIGGSAAAIGATAGLVLPLILIVGALLFVGLLAAKTMLLLLGALVFVTGPLAFALRVWPFGPMVLRAWSSLAAAVFGIPIVWTLIFAVGGVLIKDGFGNGIEAGFELDAGKTLNSWMLAIAGVATIYMALKAAKTIAGMAQAAPLAMLSSVGNGAGTAAATAGSNRSSRASTATAGEAAGNLRSQSARQMNAATTTGTPKMAAAMSSHGARTQGIQMAATSMAGPVAGQIAGAVYNKLAAPNDTQGAATTATTGAGPNGAPTAPSNGNSTPEPAGSTPARVTSGTPTASPNVAATTAPSANGVAPNGGDPAPGSTPAEPAAAPPSTPANDAPAPAASGAAAPAPDHSPARASAPTTTVPQPAAAHHHTAPAAAPSPAPNAAGNAGGSTGASTATVPQAPPAAARSLAGLPNDPAAASQAFGNDTGQKPNRGQRPTPRPAQPRHTPPVAKTPTPTTPPKGPK